MTNEQDIFLNMDERTKEQMPTLADGEPKAIAIVGMACRLPAGATNVENLWTALASGQSGWGPHPERYLPEKYYHPNPDKKGTYYTKGGHYLDGDVATFDAQFFNITAAEALVGSPFHNLRNALVLTLPRQWTRNSAIC